MNNATLTTYAGGDAAPQATNNEAGDRVDSAMDTAESIASTADAANTTDTASVGEDAAAALGAAVDGGLQAVEALSAADDGISAQEALAASSQSVKTLSATGAAGVVSFAAQGVMQRLYIASPLDRDEANELLRNLAQTAIDTLAPFAP